MSKQEEAALILKLYELRREETMRKARDWFFRDFNPQSFLEFDNAMFSANGGYVRMVVSYWDMAAALVNGGAIPRDLFNDSNAEHFFVFSKIELLLGEVRASMAPQFAVQLEKLIDATPEGRNRVAAIRGRAKTVQAKLAHQPAQAAS